MVLCSLLGAGLYADDQDDVDTNSVTDTDDIIYLSPAEVTENRETADIITREDMERSGATDLWEAVRNTPGVILSGGGRRNDSNFMVRGFGSESMPVFVDGVYTANTYRGEGDSARVLTGDLESITIEKGFSTMLLGSNTMGGAILLQTVKPKEPFEVSIKSNLDFDSMYKFSGITNVLSAGTKQRLFYGSGTFQNRIIDHYRLSSDFKPVEGNPQGKGDRIFSDSVDNQFTVLAGVTPLDGLDVSVKYLYQNSDKGVSPPDVDGDYYLWDWPLWKRKSVSVNASYTGTIFNFHTLAYFDKYDNRMDEYMDMNNYEKNNHQPSSDYDEYSTGGRFEGGWDINDRNTVKASLTFRKDNHIGLRDDVEEVRVQEDTWSAGIEYSIHPWKPFTVVLGGGFDGLFPRKFWGKTNETMQELEQGYYIVKTKSMALLSWQAGAFYDITPDHGLHLTWAVKNRFPTMFERYSTQFGSTIPNPGLTPETANHFELGYKGFILEKINLTAAVYYNLIFEKIVKIKVPNPALKETSADYPVNLDETHLWGFELGLRYFPIETVCIGGAFSLNEYVLVNSEPLVDDWHDETEVDKLPYYPTVTANLWLEFKPRENISIIPRMEYISSRYVDVDGEDKLDPYFLVHIKADMELKYNFTVSVGIENLLDANYEIRQYAPLSGRSFNVSLAWKY
jgi:iron complex outermembrane receptor protein